MNTPNIFYKFNKNTCELKVQITKRVQNVNSCDVFIDKSRFIFVADVDIIHFECPRRFQLEEMKKIQICFNTEHWEYTFILPCCADVPVESEETNINKKVDGEFRKTNNAKFALGNLENITCITDSCVLSVDGIISEIHANFSYGFAGRYRGKPKYSEDELLHICRIADPSRVSLIKRTIQRENDETNDFSPNQYKMGYAELDLEGYENPIKYNIDYEDAALTKEEECILSSILSKRTHFDIETDMTNIHCGLVSILLGICYDIRFTSNEPTCESHWTRTILSPVLSYFEQFDDLKLVVESFLRRSLIYPYHRSYELARLCVEDTLKAMQKGKSWILKQLLITYNCFYEADFNRKALNKYYIKHYIWYVDSIVNDDDLQMLSMDLKNLLFVTSEEDLRLGLIEVNMEMLKELMGDAELTMSRELEDILESNTECGSESGSETDNEYGELCHDLIKSVDLSDNRE